MQTMLRRLVGHREPAPRGTTYPTSIAELREKNDSLLRRVHEIGMDRHELFTVARELQPLAHEVERVAAEERRRDGHSRLTGLLDDAMRDLWTTLYAIGPYSPYLSAHHLSGRLQRTLRCVDYALLAARWSQLNKARVPSA